MTSIEVTGLADVAYEVFRVRRGREHKVDLVDDDGGVESFTLDGQARPLRRLDRGPLRQPRSQPVVETTERSVTKTTLRGFVCSEIEQDRLVPFRQRPLTGG